MTSHNKRASPRALGTVTHTSLGEAAGRAQTQRRALPGRPSRALGQESVRLRVGTQGLRGTKGTGGPGQGQGASPGHAQHAALAHGDKARRRQLGWPPAPSLAVGTGPRGPRPALPSSLQRPDCFSPASPRFSCSRAPREQGSVPVAAADGRELRVLEQQASDSSGGRKSGTRLRGRARSSGGCSLLPLPSSASDPPASLC